jgi:hypothetical protein
LLHKSCCQPPIICHSSEAGARRVGFERRNYESKQRHAARQTSPVRTPQPIPLNRTTVGLTQPSRFYRRHQARQAHLFCPRAFAGEVDRRGAARRRGHFGDTRHSAALSRIPERNRKLLAQHRRGPGHGLQGGDFTLSPNFGTKGGARA